MSEMMWGGRFQKAEERSALDFNASVSYRLSHKCQHQIHVDFQIIVQSLPPRWGVAVDSPFSA